MRSSWAAKPISAWVPDAPLPHFRDGRMDVTQPWRPLEASPGSTLSLAAPTRVPAGFHLGKHTGFSVSAMYCKILPSDTVQSFRGLSHKGETQINSE